MNFRALKDRDDDWQQNFFMAGSGFVNQNTPGLLLSGTMTRVVKPTIVNEMNFGYTHNRWGFKAADDFDYQSLYRSTLGDRPAAVRALRPRTTDPPELAGFGGAAGGRVAVCSQVRDGRRQSVGPRGLHDAERQSPAFPG